MASRVTEKKLVGLLYAMGRTFNGLSSTRLATSEFLQTGNPLVLGSRDDLLLLQDLQSASRFVLKYDYLSQSFDVDYLRAINACMTRTAAIAPGVLRTSESVGVHLADGQMYIPPVPNADRLNSVLHSAIVSQGTLEDAARLFAIIAKTQPFGDGNKRTALLAANGLLLAKKSHFIISVPTESADVATFNRLLSNWYVTAHTADGEIISWLAQWNREDQREVK